MKHIKTKRNQELAEEKPYEPPITVVKTLPEEEKKSHIPIYTLLVTCAVFLSMVYLFTQMNSRLDKIEAGVNAIYIHTNPNTIPIIGGNTTKADESPFCSGYDQKGVKGYAVDGRKITTPCEGVNATR